MRGKNGICILVFLIEGCMLLIYKIDIKGLIYFFVWVHIYKGYVYLISYLYIVCAKERDMYTLYIVYHCRLLGYVYIYYKIGRNAKIKIKIHTYILYILYYTYIRRITYLHTKKGTQ